MAEEFRFRPVNRLHQASEFSTIFQYRRVIRGKLFDLHWRLLGNVNDVSSKLSSARLGLVVPKRLARRAVMRNLMKRIVREAFRHRLATLPAVDLILKLSHKPDGKSLGCSCFRPSDPDFRLEVTKEIGSLFDALPSVLEKARRSSSSLTGGTV